MGSVLVVSIIVWVIVGLAIAVTMVRRGHAPAIWLALSFYGPLLALLALTAADAERDSTPRVIDRGVPGSGPVAVLVGIDASPESYAALDEVTGLLGPQLGQLTLAHVLDHDAGQITDASNAQEEAVALLAAASEHIAGHMDLTPATVVLVGAAGPALAQHSDEGDYHLIVIGSRGRGATKLVMGSTAAHLSAVAKPPVLIVRSGTSEWWTKEQPAVDITATQD